MAVVMRVMSTYINITEMYKPVSQAEILDMYEIAPEAAKARMSLFTTRDSEQAVAYFWPTIGDFVVYLPDS